MRRYVRNRKIITLIFVAFFLALTVLPARSVSAGDIAPVRRTVRVGISDSDTSSPSGGDNKTVTFEKEYLQAVAEYAGWNYEYVNAPWSECLEMAKNGEIDILMDVSKTDDRLQYFNYSSESMGTEMCCLVGRSDTALHYDDFASFDGITVGYEEGSTMIVSMREYGNRMGFSFNEKPYKSGSEMFAALDNGEIDAAVQTNFLETPDGHVFLAMCDPSPVYIVTSKRVPELKNELDSAMARLFSYSPSFNEDLYREVYGNSTARNSGFTQEETDYLNSDPVVIVLYETNWAPFEYETDGEAAGITPEIIRAIGRDTGITFRFVLASSTQAIYDELGGGSADTVMAVSYDYLWANSHDLLVTQPYISGSVMCVTRDPNVEPGSAAVAVDGYLANEVAKEYPDLEEVPYLTTEECMKAVAGGEADCTFLNYYQANYYRAMSSYDNFSYRPADSITQSIGLGVTKESNPLLLGILSKSLQRISANELQSILSENAVRPEKLTPRVLIRRYPVQMAVAIGSFSILLCMLAVMLFSARARKQRASALAEAKQEAEEANRAKSDFLSRMSHDIRTPLNGIIGMTHIAGKQQNPEKTADCLEKIDTSSRFLLGLVNEILDMSKEESGKMELHPEPYYLKDFEQYIDAVIRPLCAGKNQKLTFEIHTIGNIVPEIDILRMNQIYFNLLSNAVKYTPEGGEIRIAVSEAITQEGKDRLTVSVRDNGIGMSEDFQKVLFEPFTQEHQKEFSEMHSTGLGLSIVKKIIDAMGGTISVTSKIGVGTEFAFVMDVDYTEDKNESHEIKDTAGQDAWQSLNGKHVLLCEDHPLNQEIAVSLLAEKGILTDVAENGEAGVNHFSVSAVNYYDAVLMDIRMPVMGGYEAAKAIRALDRPDAKSVPIIAMTADAFDESIQDAKKAGMNGYVTKPVDPDKLYRTLSELIPVS